MLPNAELSRPGTTDLRFSEILRRMDNQDRALDNLTAGSNRIERSQIESTERLQARSDANALAIKTLADVVDHKDQSSIARDQQQMMVIHAEEKARQKADDEHRSELKELLVTIDAVRRELSDLKSYNRVMIAVSGFLSSIAVVYFGGHLLRLFP